MGIMCFISTPICSFIYFLTEYAIGINSSILPLNNIKTAISSVWIALLSTPHTTTFPSSIPSTLSAILSISWG